MERSESIKSIAVALNKVQKVLEGAKKDSANPFFKSKYADLESVWAAIRVPLTDNGLSISQMPYSCDGDVGIETVLMHESGEFISSIFGMKPIKNDPQAIGALITYFRRYSLMAAIGVCPEDLDAEDAMNRDAGLGNARQMRKNISPSPAQLKFLKDLMVKDKIEFTAEVNAWLEKADVMAVKGKIDDLKKKLGIE